MPRRCIPRTSLPADPIAADQVDRAIAMVRANASPMLLGAAPAPVAGVDDVATGEPAEQSPAPTVSDRRDAAAADMAREIRHDDVSRASPSTRSPVRRRAAIERVTPHPEPHRPSAG